ncbi:MAG: SH3 domain-containing protein [Lewinella sp.]|nr:SH3 domain-containing protein [Lewinella sp.]
MLTFSNQTDLSAQRQMTLGAFQNVPQQNQINPAISSESKWYVGIPLLSGLSASYRNSSFTPAQFGLNQPGGPDFLQAAAFADSINYVSGEAYVEDLAFGINVGKNFFSLSIGERFMANMQYPRELLNWIGLERTKAEIPYGETFDLGDWNFSASHYREIALGFGSKLFNDKLSLGGRAKLLLGQASVQGQSYNMRLWRRPDFDYNYEITGRMDIMASGFEHFEEGASFIQPFGKANKGVAFDLGAQLQLGNLRIFASVTDLGRIQWNQNNTLTSVSDIAVDADEIFESTKHNLTYEGDRGATAFSTELVTKIYGGGQIEIGKRHALSVMVNPRLHLGRTEMNGSAAYRFHTGKVLDLIASYNVSEERGNQIGFGATVNLKPVQIYFATDKATSVFSRNSQKDFQFVAGINLLFGKADIPKKDFALEPDALPVTPMSKDAAANNTIAPMDDNMGAAPKAEYEKYFTFYGTVVDDETDEPLDAIYVDIYVLGPDEEKELIHTSRYPGHTFNVPLFQNNLDHEISVGSYGYGRQTLRFTADRDLLIHEFRMSDGYWAPEEPPISTKSGETVFASLKEEAEITFQTRGVDTDILAADIGEDLSTIPMESMKSTPVEDTYEITQRTSFRSLPDPQATVMKRLAVGTKLELLEKTDSDWWKMKLDGKTGYVKRRLLESVQ